MEPLTHTPRWKAYLQDCSELLAIAEPMQVSGRVTRVAGLVMEAVGLKLAVARETDYFGLELRSIG